MRCRRGEMVAWMFRPINADEQQTPSRAIMAHSIKAVAPKPTRPFGFAKSELGGAQALLGRDAQAILI